MRVFFIIILMMLYCKEGKCPPYFFPEKLKTHIDREYDFQNVIKDFAVYNFFDNTSSVLPEVPIVQAILETGYGKSELFKLSNNAFSIKYFGKGCPSDKCITYAGDKYRKYKNLKGSFVDYVDIIERLYSKCLKSKTVEGQILCISTKYAEDPNYSKKLLSILKTIR